MATCWKQQNGTHRSAAHADLIQLACVQARLPLMTAGRCVEGVSHIQAVCGHEIGIVVSK